MHILLIVFATLALCASRIKCETSTEMPPIRLRSFFIDSMRTLSELRKVYDLRKKVQEEIEMKRKMDVLKIIKSFMDARHLDGQTFLRDFHTVRF
jgi:hypothetical protein